MAPKMYIISGLISLSFIITVMCTLALTKVQGIPLEVLFGDPVKAVYRISPNGQYISYLALGKTPETKNILNIWVKSYDKDDDKQITFDTLRPIRQYFWSFDNKTVFYLQDKKGNENWSLYRVNKDDPTDEKCLTPFDNIYVQIIEYNKHNPNKMLIGLNKNQLLERMIVNPDIMIGKPIIRNSRLMVQHILNLLYQGISQNRKSTR